MANLVNQTSWTKLETCKVCGKQQRCTKYLNGAMAVDTQCWCFREQLANIEPNSAEAEAFREVMPWYGNTETVWLFVAGRVRLEESADS